MITQPAPSGASFSLRSGLGRLRPIAFALLAVAVAGAIFAGRVMTRSHGPTVAAVATAPGPMPTNPALERAWGIRFTSAYLLADSGLIDLRYQVLDQGLAERLHAGAQNTANLPTVLDERSRQAVTPMSSIYHIHHGTPGEGTTYSIIYGNARNAIRIGDLITIEMTDHLELQHIKVTN